MNVIENAIKHGQQHQSQESANQNSLFGGMDTMIPQDPEIPKCEPWSNLEKLQKEKHLVGVYISGHPLDAYKLEIETFTDTAIDDLQPIEGRKVRFAGIISDANTRFSKSGDKFCRFVIEDYSGSKEFMLFKRDYLDHGRFVEHVGNMVYVTGAYERPWSTAKELRFKVKSVCLLSEVKEKYSKQLSITLNADQVSDGLIEELNELFARHTGNLDLRMTIIDPDLEKPLNFLSRKYRVDVSQELLDRLENDLNVVYKLN